MTVVLYIMLTLNLGMLAISIANHDEAGAWHAATFGLVAVAALVLRWMVRKGE